MICKHCGSPIRLTRLNEWIHSTRGKDNNEYYTCRISFREQGLSFEHFHTDLEATPDEGALVEKILTKYSNEM